MEGGLERLARLGVGAEAGFMRFAIHRILARARRNEGGLCLVGIVLLCAFASDP